MCYDRPKLLQQYNITLLSGSLSLSRRAYVGLENDFLLKTSCSVIIVLHPIMLLRKLLFLSTLRHILLALIVQHTGLALFCMLHSCFF